jgi:hypothetical protein
VVIICIFYKEKLETQFGCLLRNSVLLADRIYTSLESSNEKGGHADLNGASAGFQWALAVLQHVKYAQGQKRS